MALTRDDVFFNAFDTHAAKSVEASKLLVEMLADISKAPKLSKRIKDLEHEADKITHDCVAALHQTWITPLDREEIHALISRLDDVLDSIEAASERVILFEISEVTPEVKDLAQAVVASCEAMHSAVQSLRDINKQSKKILALCVEINKHENTADLAYRTAVAKLFKPGNDPLLVMKWRDIYDHLETATDQCEDVANIIEGVVLEHA
jgi:predicted phosphate transport protein (TIGR00153 family)